MEPSPHADSSTIDVLLERVLTERGAEQYGHTGQRALKDHLVGTWRILNAWDQPEMLCHAGLLHSCYTTDAYPYPLFDFTERAFVRQLIGADSEERVFLFCSINRRDLFQKLVGYEHIPKEGIEVLFFRTGHNQQLSDRIVADLLIMEMANAAEQTMGEAGWPGEWVATVARLGHLVRDLAHPVPPVFDSCTGYLTAHDENQARELYYQGLTMLASDPQSAATYLTDATLHNPWVAEPWLFLALISLEAEQWHEALLQADHSSTLYKQWGTAWDKRRLWSDWLETALQVKNMATRALAEAID